MKPSEIREIVEILDNSQIQEIEIKKWWGYKLKVSKIVGTIVAAAPAPVVQAVAAQPASAAAPVDLKKTDAAPAVSGTEVKAPMVGTFYRAPTPDATPFIKEGDVVSKGQVLCIIEAMKLMNEIEAEVSGKIIKILVENAQPVEYGQPLFIIDPS